MTCETMKSSHLDGVAKLQLEWVDENITYGFAAGTAEQIAEAMTPFCYVMKRADKIIGYLMAEVRHSNEYCVFPKGASFVEVYDLFVTNEYRSHGVGKKLLEHCEQEARAAGIKHILISSATKDADAVRNFYANKNDYTIWTTQFFKHLG